MESRTILDEKDRKIITLLCSNPGISQEEIAREISLSQPSVAMRIKKLKEKGFVENMKGINIRKVGLLIAKVDVTARNPAQIIERFKECPFFLNGFTVSGEYNLCLFFIGENIVSLESIVDTHLREDENVKNVKFNVVTSIAKDFIFPYKPEMDTSIPLSCGMEKNCNDCVHYQSNRCLGCPLKASYKGVFW